MRKLAFSDDAVEFDGTTIGYTRTTDLGSVYAYAADNNGGGVFDSKEAAHAWLVERYEKSKIGDDEGVV